MKAMRLWLVLPLLLLACDSWPGVSGDGGLGGGGVTQVEDSSGNFGSSCGTTVTCGAGLKCISGAPNGMCSKNCAQDSDCALYGAKCLLAFATLMCVKTCASDQMCRPSYTCQTTSAGQVCLQGTAVGADQ